MLLPIVLISMIRMVNNRKIMGDRVNNGFQNAVGWTSTIVLIGLTVILIVDTMIKLFKP